MNLGMLIGGIKMLVGTISGLGVTTLCSAAAGDLAAKTGASVAKKVLMAIGGAVIGSMVADQAYEYVSKQIDGAVEVVTAAVGDAGKDGVET